MVGVSGSETELQTSGLVVSFNKQLENFTYHETMAVIILEHFNND